jgi:hypothetical protein
VAVAQCQDAGCDLLHERIVRRGNDERPSLLAKSEELLDDLLLKTDVANSEQIIDEHDRRCAAQRERHVQAQQHPVEYVRSGTCSNPCSSAKSITSAANRSAASVVAARYIGEVSMFSCAVMRGSMLSPEASSRAMSP